MSEMIERVAAAMWVARGDYPKTATEIKMIWPAVRPELEAMARAAIEAMRDMTPVVRENGEVVHELRGAPADIWSTMMDAALGPLPVFSTKPVE
jgi:hypothetical protein